MELESYLNYLNSGKTVKESSEEFKSMHKFSQEAIKICMEINNKYNSPDQILELMQKLTGKNIDKSFCLFPPFYTDFGKNITVGKRVFINAGCKFQDQGGIKIGDDVLIGHNVVFATLNHEINPKERKNITPSPIIVHNNVWIGSNSTILPGVIIGKNSIIGAGSIVNKNVPENTIVGGVPAKILKNID